MNNVRLQITAEQISNVLLENCQDLPERMASYLRTHRNRNDLSPLATRLLNHDFILKLRKRHPECLVEYTTGEMEWAILTVWKNQNLLPNNNTSQ